MLTCWNNIIVVRVEVALLTCCLFLGVKHTRKILKKGVVPSVFIWSKVEENPAVERRKKRAEARNIKQQLFLEKQRSSRHLEDNVPDPVTHEVEIISEDKEATMVECTIDNIPQYRSVGTQRSYAFYTVETFRNDNKGIHFYTGLETFEKFMFVFNTLCPEAYSLRYRWSQVLNVSVEDQFLMTLMKLRRNKEDYELGRYFDIDPSSVSNIFVTWINFIHQMWEMLNTWPSRELINFNMPEGFLKFYPSTRVIVDCTEIPIQKPSNPAAQQAVWSSYKNRSTVKMEVGASPSGLLSHCSDAYSGSTSDRQMAERSSLLHKCDRGDSIMADRGLNAQDLFAAQGVSINIPTFFKGRSQFPGITVLQDRKLSSKRVHIERIIGLTKTYKILQVPVHQAYVPLLTKIYFVCQMLCNFREGIISHNA